MKLSTRNKLDSLFANSKVRHFKKGHILIFSGDTSDQFYKIVRGKIKVYDVNYRGDEVIINKFGPPAYFPMSLMLNSTNTNYIYEVDDDVEIMSIHKDLVIPFLNHNPLIVMDLFSDLYLVIDEILSKYVLVTTKNAKARLIYAIITECKKFAKKDANGIYTLEMSESELAATSGLSRETISREIKILKAEKLISSGRRSIEVASISKLEEHLRTHA